MLCFTVTITYCTNFVKKNPEYEKSTVSERFKQILFEIRFVPTINSLQHTVFLYVF